MRSLTIGISIIVASLLVPTAASGITFGEWASGQGYSPGEVMPSSVYAADSSMDSLSGIGGFDWTTTPTTYLGLLNNQLTSIEAGTFTGLTNLRSLSLKYNQMSRIETAAFSGLTVLESLDLFHNQIASIDAGAFSGLPNLTTLNLAENQLPSIEAGDFSGLTNLDTLYLYDNQISSIETGGFSGLTNLEYLNLHDNQLTSIEAGDFGGLTNLVSLYLYGNQITSIEADDFSGLPSLGGLWLSDNQISSLDSFNFSGLPTLGLINLDDNQISEIKAGDYSGLTSLVNLSLSGNQLTSIEAGDFSELPNLNTIDLADNQIESIEVGAFSELTRRLALEGNQLTTIEAELFRGLPILGTLRLEHNQISNIQSGAFSGMENLVWLNLANNPALTELNLTRAQFSRLGLFNLSGGLYYNLRYEVNITRVSLNSAQLNQDSFETLMNGGGSSYVYGIGEVDGIIELDLSGIDFVDITDLAPLYTMDDLTDLWLVGTRNLDAFQLDALLNELETIEGTDVEGILHMTQADFNAFNTAGGGLLAAWHAEPGHHVAFVIPEPATLLLVAVASFFVLARKRSAGN